MPVPNVGLAGRQAQLALVCSALRQATDCRALFVLGEAGLGKSRLIQAAVEQAAREDGVTRPASR